MPATTRSGAAKTPVGLIPGAPSGRGMKAPTSKAAKKAATTAIAKTVVAAITAIKKVAATASAARPDFTASAKRLAALTVETSKRRFSFTTTFGDNKTDQNLAIPHRVSWKDMWVLTEKFAKSASVFENNKFIDWTDKFLTAGNVHISKSNAKYTKHHTGATTRPRTASEISDLKRKWELHVESQDEFQQARDEFFKLRDPDSRIRFEKAAFNFHANVPDYGPHKGVNNPVRERFHPDFNFSIKVVGTPDPITEAMSSMLLMLTPVAIDHRGRYIQTNGETIAHSQISAAMQTQFSSVPKSTVGSFIPGVWHG